MKVAITSAGPGLDDAASLRFGRCPYFIFVDTETLDYEAVENSNAAAGGGAGVQSAQLVVDRDVKTVLTGNCGPKAFAVFEAAEIPVLIHQGGSVRFVIEQFKAGAYKPANEANVEARALFP